MFTLKKEKGFNLKEVYQKAKNGDENARTFLIEKHKPLIFSLIKKYHVIESEKDDLFSCAMIGLINAINKYDESFNTEFSTYAVPLILGEIKKYFRDNNLVFVSRKVKENYKRITAFEKEYDEEKSPSIETICLELNLTKEEVLEALESNIVLYSLDAPLDDNNDITLLDTISSKEKWKDLDLAMSISKLTSKEQLIINMRYYDGLSQKEVAERLYMNQVQVSRIEKKIIEKLKNEYVK